MTTFMTTMYSRAQMETECVIMTLIYVERLLKAANGGLYLLPTNWKTTIKTVRDTYGIMTCSI